jgi:hypothetical protein
MTLISGFFLVPLGLVAGFMIFGIPAMLVFGGIALALAVVLGTLLTRHYMKLESSSPDEDHM